jgi:6-aminohexanoate-oligomer endohydrolase
VAGPVETPSPRLVTPSEFKPGCPGNDDFALTPQPSPGRASVKFDFPGVFVGTAEYPEGPTGCTVISIPEGARTYVDDRGGGAVTVLCMRGAYAKHHAICLTGGSAYGLGAITGVSAELLRRNKNRGAWDEIKLVSGAVIYDLSPRDNMVVPDAALGRAALLNAEEGSFPVGRCGAGRSGTCGKFTMGASPRSEFAGQGAAYRAVGRIKILVGVVVNALGVVVDRDGRIVRGNYDAETGARRSLVDEIDASLKDGKPITARGGNTTLTVLVTNVRLEPPELRQVARVVHDSMSRAIQPFHTAYDGDTLFALSTDKVRPKGFEATGLAAIASELAWDAVLASVE